MATPASLSEDGEIIENGVEDSSKAAPRQFEGTGVDRRDRHRGRHSRSPDHALSYRQPRRSVSPRGYKRPRDDRDAYHGGRNGDFGRSRPHNDAAPDRHNRLPYDDVDRNRPRGSSSRYEDLDHPASRASGRRDHYYDREAYPSKRRDRAGGDDRMRRDRNGFGRNMYGDQAKSFKYAQNEREPRDGSTSKRTTVADATSSNNVAKSEQGVTTEQTAERGHGETSDARERARATEAEASWEAPEPVDEDAEIERRRKRREEILRKSRASTPALLQAVQTDQAAVTPASTHQSTPRRTAVNTPRSGKASIPHYSPGTADQIDAGSPSLSPSVPQEAMSPADLDLASDQDFINLHGETKAHEEDGPSAADYDPTVDMREDERREELRHGHVGLHGEQLQPDQPGVAPAEPVNKRPEQDDDDFDMFADDFDDDKYAPPKTAESNKATKEASDENDAAPGIAEPQGGGILEGDDKDGYYKIRPGEVLYGRYQVQSTLGKGMFSGVARAMDITSRRLVAIKIMRNNDALRKGGFTEIAILQKLNAADPDGKKHIVKFERSFEYKAHLCMAFENLSMNLREVLKKFGNNVGINLNATRAYAYQIFLALGHMRKCSIIHADLKPDNILVNENRNVLKICDLGTAVDRADAATAHNEITPYLVSRFYRAPEIILGMPYDYAIDMWSIGCTLYEMYTGKILFTGDSNNQMLKTMMEIRGKFSAKLYRRGQLAHMHFDELGNFISVERDKALGKTTVRTLSAVKPTRDLRTRLMAASGGMNDAETRELNHFIELLERCLALNPDRRITPSEALKHPFFTHRVHAYGR